VYSLRRARNREKLRPFADLVRSFLAHPLRLETVLYKFYKLGGAPEAALAGGGVEPK
jgi:hypothetical protein